MRPTLIYDGNCGYCHYDEGQAANLSPIRLDNAANSYATTVGQDAPQSGTTMKLVNPGSAATSYLLHKIKGTHLDPAPDGSGTRMPPPAVSGALDEDAIDAIEAWINGGATDD